MVVVEKITQQLEEVNHETSQWCTTHCIVYRRQYCLVAHMRLHTLTRHLLERQVLPLLLPLMVELHPYLDHKRQLVAEDGMDRSLTVEWLEIDLLLVADKLD